MYDHELILISETFVKDEWGNYVPSVSRDSVLCEKKSVGRSEFYVAGQTGLRPEIVFVVKGYEYEGQARVEFEGKEYSVLRTYQTDFEEIELVCGQVLGSG